LIEPETAFSLFLHCSFLPGIPAKAHPPSAPKLHFVLAF